MGQRDQAKDGRWRPVAGVPGSNEELTAFARSLSLQAFALPFLHACRYNGRLRSSGGRYLLTSHDIEMNPKSVEVHGRDELQAVMLHELCHYHLHLAGRGHRHGDADFKRLLRAVGGSRYARPLPPQKPARCLKYVCCACGRGYQRVRRIDVMRYVCGACGGRLVAMDGERNSQ
jgi:SprT-like protein